jgi:hypothetical protein
MIDLLTPNGVIAVEAEIKGEFAVHPIIGWQEAPGYKCYSVSYIPMGVRLTYGGRVFLTVEDTQEFVEEFAPLSNNWRSVFMRDPDSHHVLIKFIAIGKKFLAAGKMDTFQLGSPAPTRH